MLPAWTETGKRKTMLGLSHTAGYALMALGFLEGSDGRWVLARDIAAATGIAGPYLSKILHTLAKAGLIRAKRGYRGGFVLSRPASQISLTEVLAAVAEPLWSTRCLLGLVECSDERDCPIHRMWKTTRTRLQTSMQQLTLADVAGAVRQRAGGARRQAGGSAGRVPSRRRQRK